MSFKSKIIGLMGLLSIPFIGKGNAHNIRTLDFPDPLKQNGSGKMRKGRKGLSFRKEKKIQDPDYVCIPRMIRRKMQFNNTNFR